MAANAPHRPSTPTRIPNPKTAAGRPGRRHGVSIPPAGNGQMNETRAAPRSPFILGGGGKREGWRVRSDPAGDVAGIEG